MSPVISEMTIIVPCFRLTEKERDCTTHQPVLLISTS